MFWNKKSTRESPLFDMFFCFNPQSLIAEVPISYICNYTRLYLVILSSPSPIFFCLFVCLFVCSFFHSLVCVVERRVFSPHYFLYCIMLNTNQERKVGTKTRFYCTPCSGWLGTGREFLCGLPATIISDIKGAWHLWQLKSLW